MQGKWIRKPTNDTAVVFVHGILSSGETCWQHENGTYWPVLLKNEQECSTLGIYVYTYETGIFSGTYSLNDVVDDVKERLITLDRVADNSRIIFVCHSMGGIVVRKLLVERANDLVDREIRVGLFLVASPSLGASYANWLEPLAKVMGHAQADALRFTQSNTWLNGLDKEFQNLKESGRLRIEGKELVEDRFVVLRKFWRKQVVEPFSGTRYFGEPYKVPGSDHFSIAKPKNQEAVQHRLMVAFIKRIIVFDEQAHKEEASAAASGLDSTSTGAQIKNAGIIGIINMPDANFSKSTGTTIIGVASGHGAQQKEPTDNTP
jgi:pimeloyl-ACP methyl ester carboxylesterase